MSRHNNVDMLGVVSCLEDPIINMTTGKAEYRFHMVTVRDPSRKVEDHSYVNAQDIQVVAYKRSMHMSISTLRVGDVVQLKGVICSMPQLLAVPCSDKNCQHVFEQSVLDVFVVPINLAVRAHIPFENEKEGRTKAIQMLYENAAFSNNVSVIGHVSSTPKLFPVVKSGAIELQYQLHMNRRYRIRQQLPTLKEDWPWVKVYGQAAEEDKKWLRKGTKVCIDGYLQNARRPTTKECPECGTKNKFVRVLWEIVPFATEYLVGVNTPDEVDFNEREQRMQKNVNMFSEVPDDDVEGSMTEPFDSPDNYLLHQDAEAFEVDEPDDQDDTGENYFANLFED